MASTSKRWALITSRVACCAYFFLIIFQLPLFRFPCRIGICTTPIEITSSQLIATEILPQVVVKSLLYPGAIANAIVNNKPMPSFHYLLNEFNNFKEVPPTTDLQHLEVLAGSYFSVAGAILGLLNAGRLSLFGMLLLTWGLAKEAVLAKYAVTYPNKALSIYPTMSIAVVFAFLSVRRDVRKLIRHCKAKRIANPSINSRTAMPFHTLNYPSHGLHSLSMHRTLHKTRTNRVLAMPPTSIITRIDESGKHPNKSSGSNTALRSSNPSGSLLNQSNAVGIIGGVSVNSTLTFVTKLVKWSSKDGKDGLPFVLCSDSVLNKELSYHERCSFAPIRTNERLQMDYTSVVGNLWRKRVFLEHSGARCIVMPCHISHSWHDEISKGCSIPVLHVGECVARELKEAKLRPLEAGSLPRVGVLATSATLAAGIYQEKLKNEGFEVVLPDKATMEHTVIPAVDALSRNDIEGARNLLRIALQVLLVRAVNTVILASDDMQELLPRDDPLLRKCIDPMDALARSTIKFAQSTERGP
ncbi:hypothetical protein RJ640_021232 [Escallonia rubra]|uniref:Aspartate racemase n=1 Tax=Escallonia rubra TaxID=112253 RepID=A0AA88R3A1_9ASTE|nr:hypothetical protein RJ640_021232 [Escallonia rubra]